MKNVREGIIDADNVNFLNTKKSPNALLVSGMTLKSIIMKQLESSRKEPDIFSEETPLVKGDPTNVIVQAASAVAGFDVTQIPPVKEEESIPEIQPVTIQSPVVETPSIEEEDVRSAIDKQIVTPQEVIREVEPAKVEMTPEVPPVAKPDPYVSLNIKLEEIRSKYQSAIEDLRSDTNRKFEELKEKLNKDFDELSRNIESVRVIEQNSVNDLRKAVESQRDIYSQDLYNQGMYNGRQ